MALAKRRYWIVCAVLGGILGLSVVGLLYIVGIIPILGLTPDENNCLDATYLQSMTRLSVSWGGFIHEGYEKIELVTNERRITCFIKEVVHEEGRERWRTHDDWWEGSYTLSPEEYQTVLHRLERLRLHKLARRYSVEGLHDGLQTRVVIHTTECVKRVSCWNRRPSEIEDLFDLLNSFQSKCVFHRSGLRQGGEE
jgi:hypothetical protein